MSFKRKFDDKGFGMMEIIFSILVISVAALAAGQFLVVTIRSGTMNSYRVEVLNQARAKLEEIKAIPYDQIGILASTGTGGEGYLETDPFYNPTYGAGDSPLSDQVELSTGAVITLSVTVEAVDDGADGSGEGDWDLVTDPNTGTTMDYKLVTVRIDTTDPTTGIDFTTELATIMKGVLDGEVDGAGADEDSKDKKKKKKAKKDKKKGSKGKGHDSDKQEKNKKGRKGESDGDDD